MHGTQSKPQNLDDIVRPARLLPGATVAIWAPSFPIGGRYPRRLQRGIAALRECGFKVHIDPTCVVPGGLTALPPKKLAQAFHELLEHPGVNAIIAAVGGWTANAMLPYLDYEHIRRARKVIVGYSDVSALLLAVLARSRLVTFHGPAVLSEWGESGGVSAYTRHNFLSLLSGIRVPSSVAPPAETTDEFLAWDREDSRPRDRRPASPWQSFRRGEATGRLVGGCMSTLALQFGSRYVPSLQGMLLFLEEEATTPDRHLAYLESFRQRGVFSEIAGLIMGRLSRPLAMANGFSDFLEPLRLALRDTAFPIALDVDLGHTEPMLTLPIGTLASLSCEERGVSLNFLEESVTRDADSASGRDR